MKESIGGTALFIIVVVLILLFSSIMAFTINHSNAFSVKDALVSIIEDSGGFDLEDELIEGARQDEADPLYRIVDALSHYSYRQTGKCPESDGNEYQVVGYTRDGKISRGRDDSSFCIVKIKGKDYNGVVQKYYYQIVVFYSLDIPVIKSIFNFKEVGETKALFK